MIVVGGGLAGLYCGWKLLMKGEGDVTIYDESTDVGGRIQSIVSSSGGVVELGACRFSTRVHPRLTKLAQALGVATTPLYHSTPTWVLRSRRVELNDFALGSVPYNLEAGERGHSPQGLFDSIVHPAHMDRRNISFSKLISDRVSAEACCMLRDASGYDLLFDDCLAASEGVRIIGQHPETDRSGKATIRPEWLQAKHGAQRIASEVRRELEKLSGRVVSSHRLVEIQEERDRVALSFEHEGRLTTVSTDRVILALPRLALEAISIKSGRGGEILSGILAVQPVPMLKAFLQFSESWWTRFGAQDGSFCVTDLPIRKVYYGPDGHLLIYTDSGSALLWKRILDHDACWPGFFQKMMLQCIGQMHGVSPAEIPEPEAVLPKFWPAGVHVWKTGSNPGMTRSLLFGRRDQRIHVCGESFASSSGWMEGALESVDDLFQHLYAESPRDRPAVRATALVD